MADFNLAEAQAFQSRVIERVREIERMLDSEVIAYYRADRVDNEADARENFRGLHDYLRRAYRDFDQLLTEVEQRPEYR